MRRQMFGAKIHRAVITAADLDYEGSVTIDADLMERAGILPYEAVHLWNVSRGTRLMTYALPGPRASGVICVNGAAAHHNQVGDTVIIATFVELADDEARTHTPRVVQVDAGNRAVADLSELPGPARREAIGPRVA
ncbi:MAG: aspartate 1-decarboxylase [Deltaproteobacteria bacterium]|nr:aspartate 1-decarboxylase [Deltaproteobacteria bacterium]